MSKENVVWGGMLPSPKREQNLAVCNVSGPQGHYAKQDKSEKAVLYDITYTWNLKQKRKKETHG